MATLPAVQQSADIVERVVIAGDLSNLQPAERVAYYRAVCESMGLNPLTKPFQYITLNNKLTLYATRDCTDQLRKRDRISVTFPARETLNDCYVVTARATAPDGRTDESTGVVSIGNLRGDALANAMMKAETKAKRRVTLSIAGLGWLDETELETVPTLQVAPVDAATGVIEGEVTETKAEEPKPAPQALKPGNGHTPTGADARKLDALRRTLRAKIAGCVGRYALDGVTEDSAYEAIKAERGIAHLAEYQGDTAELIASVTRWFEAQVSKAQGGAQ